MPPPCGRCEHDGPCADLVLPGSALAEVLVGSHRLSAGHATARRRQLEAVFRVRPVDADVADEAARLRAVHRSLRLPDALALATGHVEAAEVLTADSRWTAYGNRVVLL